MGPDATLGVTCSRQDLQDLASRMPLPWHADQMAPPRATEAAPPALPPRTAGIVPAKTPRGASAARTDSAAGGVEPEVFTPKKPQRLRSAVGGAISAAAAARVLKQGVLRRQTGSVREEDVPPAKLPSPAEFFGVAEV